MESLQSIRCTLFAKPAAPRYYLMLLFGLQQCFSNTRQQPPQELQKGPEESSSRTGKCKAGWNYSLEVFVLGREQLNAFNCWTQLSVHKHQQPVITEHSDFLPPKKLSRCQFNSCIKTDDAKREATLSQSLRNTDLQECMTTLEAKRLQQILPLLQRLNTHAPVLLIFFYFFFN